MRDKEIIDFELQLKDLETIESRIIKAKKLAKIGNKDGKVLLDLLEQYKVHLESGNSARSIDIEDEKKPKDLFLLTDKPVLYVCNVDEASIITGNKYVEAIKEIIKDENANLLVIAAQTEADIAELDEYEERQMFLEDLGLKVTIIEKDSRLGGVCLNVGCIPSKTLLVQAPSKTQSTEVIEQTLFIISFPSESTSSEN